LENAQTENSTAGGQSCLTNLLDDVQTATDFPPVLDACCGSRMFWFDRKDARATFVDKRRERHTLPDISSKGGSRELVIDPDRLADFTDLPFLRTRLRWWFSIRRTYSATALTDGLD